MTFLRLTNSPFRTLLIVCTSPSFPRSGLPSLPSHILWSNFYPVSKHHPRFLSLPFISCTKYSHLLDQLVVSYTSHLQTYSHPPQFFPLHLISLKILFISLTLQKSVPVPRKTQLTVHCHPSIAYPIFLYSLLKITQMWRDMEEISTSRRWHL